MRRPARLAAVLVLALAFPACGKLFGPEEEAEAEPCPRVDMPARALAGAAIRQPAGVGLFELLPVEGRTTRSGQLARFSLADYTFRARPDDSGGFSGRRGAQAQPIAGLVEDGSPVGAYEVSYTKSGDAFAGQVLVGPPSPGTRLALAGQARYRGPVRLVVQDRRPEAAGDSLRLDGTANMLVRFGSASVDVAFDGLSFAAQQPDAPAEMPFARLDWADLTVCGVRVGSSGQGGFQASDADGQSVRFAGEGSAAMLDATLYGFDEGKAQPTEIGGVLLIQGDAGVISGIFAAQRTN